MMVSPASGMAVPGTAAPDGELGALYAGLSRQVHRLVRAGVNAPEPVIEDACQFAWSRLVGKREDVNADAVLGWLARTATREALKLIWRQRSLASLECELELHGECALRASSPGPEDLFETRERLTGCSGVTERQRRLLWLHAFGLCYDEIAQHEGCTRRSVERQLLRAKRACRSKGP